VDSLTQTVILPRPSRGRPLNGLIHKLTVCIVSKAFCVSALVLSASAAPSQTLDVIHWWTSSSERAAADVLAQALKNQGLKWEDAAIEGGGGGAAVKVLKSRVLSGSPPAAAQLIGKMLTDWSDLGLVLPLNRVAEQDRWEQQFFPEVLQLVSHKNQRIAVPLGIHRINSVLYQQAVFQRLRLALPSDWSSLERVAHRLLSAGITPIAWSDEAWQVATVFEAVLLSHAGPELYTRLVLAQDADAWMDPKVADALNRLRWLRALNGNQARTEVSWIDNVKAFRAGQVGMLMNGDWSRGELLALAQGSEADFSCLPMPGTEGMHLYSIDTLTMLKGKSESITTQEKAAGLLASLAVQKSYNRVKGSVPVRKDFDPSQMDTCARQSWQTFAHPQTQRVPSLAHRMAASEVTKEAIAHIVQSFVLQPWQKAALAQGQLSAVVRAMFKENARP
jgi:glucose/mannose transport system substrate-binding protein